MDSALRPRRPARGVQPRCEPGLRRELPGPDRPLLQVTAILEEGECVILRCPRTGARPRSRTSRRPARDWPRSISIRTSRRLRSIPDADASAGAGPLRYLPQVGEIRTGPLQVAVTRTGEAYSKSSTRSPGGPARVVARRSPSDPSTRPPGRSGYRHRPDGLMSWLRAKGLPHRGGPLPAGTRVVTAGRVLTSELPHNPYLVASRLTDQPIPMPWFGNRQLSIRLA